ncbi:hypothetical protein PV326_000613 [Microctonus aethiopoides]|nr:hypothetical protein PV326_000613 [Microctonus aethiopoides]
MAQSNQSIGDGIATGASGEYAARIIEEDIRTMDNLIKFIRSHFEGPPVPYTDRIVEFKSVRQAQYERVSVYGDRVTKILREIVDDITQSDADGKEEREKIVTEIAVSAFIKGLRPQYVRLLKKVKFERLALAIKEAIEAKTLCTEFSNLGTENNTISCFNVQREQKQNTRTSYTNNKHCNYCNRVGHEWNQINDNITYELKGVSKHHKPRTLGSISLNLNDLNGIFHVIPEDFPLDYVGIIGTEFMHAFGKRAGIRTLQREQLAVQQQYSSDIYFSIELHEKSGDYVISVTLKDVSPRCLKTRDSELQYAFLETRYDHFPLIYSLSKNTEKFWKFF